ncbi:divalent-cation tolerance protein CutA [Candidatus Micrarchaeota archaeon]|nr:divalent-cation tolerance protein CutA [Candidatus Micrarchaeota archaeon]
MAVVLAYIVCAHSEEAETIGEELVREKLVACANVVTGVKSIFSWQGKIEKKTEAILFCKTVSEKEKAIEKKVKSLHSYALPGICFYPAEHVSAEYEKWVHNSVSGVFADPL